MIDYPVQESRDVIKFGEITDNISEKVQDSDRSGH